MFLRGHLQDRGDLARTLGIGGHRECTPASLIAGAYQRWGAALQRHVRGEYAAAILDRRAQLLLLTHDAIGLGQIFYSVESDSISFGTHLLDLLETKAYDLDQEYLATYLARGYLTTARTPFTSFRRLLPGMSLTWTRTACRLLHTWRVADIPPLHLPGDRDYEERFRSLLDDAVRATLNPAGNTWVALSGGLDSSSVLSAAAHLELPRIGAYSFVSPSSPQGDEQPWARAVIDRYPVPWHTLDSSTALPFSEPPDSFPFQAEPTSAVLHIKTHRLLDALFREHNVHTVLTGHGGDALLGAGAGPVPGYLADLLFSGHPLDALAEARRWSSTHRHKRSLSFVLLHGLLRPAIDHLRGYRFDDDPALPLPGWMEPACGLRWRILHRARQRPATRDRFPGRQAIWDSVWCHAVSGGSARVHAGYDVRRPLLYRPLFEFMFAIPGAQRTHPRCDRYLQRRALRGILPEAVRRRGHKTFGTWAFIEGLAQSPAWIEYLCEGPRLADLGVTTAQKWREAMKRASVGDTSGDRFFLAGITLEAWLKQWAQWRPESRGQKVEVRTTI